MTYDVAVIGGGPAGLAAALEARKNGAQKVLIIERDKELGGILNQCIHNGFGLHYFKEELTGPEYAQRFIDEVNASGIDVKLDTMVLTLTPEKEIHGVNTTDGYFIVTAKSIVLAMGCRERTRGAISIPGTPCSGIFTAGTAQRYMNIEGYMVGKRVVILGSGDIGLIMARRMTLEGAKVLACVELLPYSGGLNRNIVQCLQDYDIPLYLSHTVTEIRGRRRLEQVVVSQVDEHRRPVPGTEQVFNCDTLLLSVGLIPENELSRSAGIRINPKTSGPVVYENMETSMEGVFAAGNVVHVHDLVDYVTAESQRAGKSAALYARAESQTVSPKTIALQTGALVNYTVPQFIRPEKVEKAAEVFFRVAKPVKNGEIRVSCGETVLLTFPRAHMAPGEMEHIVLPKKALEEANDMPITLSVVEKEDA